MSDDFWFEDYGWVSEWVMVFYRMRKRQGSSAHERGTWMSWMGEWVGRFDAELVKKKKSRQWD